MFHYAFSNDLRFDKNVENINEFIRTRAGLWLSDSVPSAKKYKSLNNTSNSAGIYFNLKNKGNCAKAAVQGNTQKVILNFIKKFQFPNPIVKNMQKTVDDHIRIAPLRTIVKLLYVIYMNEGEDGYISYDEIKDFIFYNKLLVIEHSVTINDVYNQIKEFRKSGKLPLYIADVKEREWNQEDRQLGSMLYLLCESKCINEENNNYKINYFNLNNENKAEILDILTYDKYWDGVDKRSYQEYMEIEDNFEINVDEFITENKENDQILLQKNELIPGENRIYYGAPGTGKSHTVEEISAKEFEISYRTTFYPEYTHDDFVGTFMPVMNYEKQNPPKEYLYADGTLSGIIGKPVPYYTFVPGPFAHALVDALNNADKNVLLVIEELNRANAAAVFGEIFQLLDRKYEGKESDGESRYDINIANEFSEYISSKVQSYNIGDKIKIPRNLSIYATMNSADQGVSPLDSAFKRRWNYIYIPIDFKKAIHKEAEINYAGKKVTWENFGQTINDKLVNLNINEDKLLGEYFVNPVEIKDADRFIVKVISYLFDDVLKFNRRGFFKPEYKTFSELKNNFSSKEIFDFQFEEKQEEGKGKIVEYDSYNEETVDMVAEKKDE